MMIAMLFGTATVQRLEGDLDDIVEQVFGEDAGNALVLGDEGLDSPVLWVDDEDLTDTTPEDAALSGSVDGTAALSAGRVRVGGARSGSGPQCLPWAAWGKGGWLDGPSGTPRGSE
ncbi:hypothetical protein ACFYXM_10670 [Streptomyces sp. NPDC002476]|uniref:hypothetical protein n=1 Tax=Streptomyces sp. NPDC002476 TaxID=3364648 RepID=UPI0036C05337